MREENIYTNRPSNLKINPKYYPLIWIVAIVCAFFSTFYETYTSIALSNSVPLIIYSLLIDMVAGGGISVLLIWLVAVLLFNMGAKRGLRAIPKNDFIYSILILMSIIWFVSGAVNLFCFLDPMASLYNGLVTIPAVTIVLSALMFFLVYVPKYLNPRMAKRYFDYYGKMYVIFNGILYFIGALGLLASAEMIENPAVMEMIEEYYVAFSGMSVEMDQVMEMLTTSIVGIKVSAILSCVITAGMIVAYVVLSKMLTKKASEFKDDTPSDDMGRVIFTDGTNFYTVDDLKNNNPFGTDGGKNPFEDDNKNDKIFDEFDL
ncbi:MAG: hypothetical protein J6V37_03680 [Clostridia bacterium]|nr:hypothetical protein [Clostridia bacterium]